MKIKHMKQAVSLLDNEWDLGEKEAKASGNICAWIYLMEILERSEKIVTYKEKDKLIGFCGYTKNNSKKYIVRKKFYSIIKKLLYKSKKIEDAKALKDYNDNYEYLPEELSDYFDGEISILIVDKNHRGKNIGKKLLVEIFELAKKDNINILRISTDESSNYKFYESCGCNKIYETIIEYGKLNRIQREKTYIYEKQLN